MTSAPAPLTEAEENAAIITAAEHLTEESMRCCPNSAIAISALIQAGICLLAITRKGERTDDQIVEVLTAGFETQLREGLQRQRRLTARHSHAPAPEHSPHNS